MTFFAKGEQSPVKEMQISGSAPANVFKNGYLNNIADGDPLTYYLSADSNAFVTFDLLKPVELAKIEIIPRTDDNFIRIGDEYELFYHGGSKGWISLGKRSADQLFLTYDNIPANALLWLKNHTRGKEEQVFYFMNGKQEFTGKENIIY